MTPDGGAVNEKIVLNDITLWSGGPQDAKVPVYPWDQLLTTRL